MLKIRILLFLYLSITAFRLLAADILDLEFDVSEDVSISIRHHVAESSQLLIWLPPERGISPENSSVADAVANLGSNVWLVDLHSSYMVSRSRYSIGKIPVDDILHLFRLAEQKGYRQIYLVSASRGAKLALRAIYQYCKRYPQSDLLKGSIFFHPNLFDPVSAFGQAAEFAEGTDTSHLPVYLIQAEFSTKYAYTQDTRQRLEQGGSQVFTQVLPEVEAGFVSGAVEDLSKESLSARQRLPKTIDNAIRLLSGISPGKLRKASKPGVKQNRKLLSGITGLHPFKGNKQSPALSLLNLDGNQINLNAFRGRVVLLNFWASWCGPCVDEIPSLERLSKLYDADRFTVVTVNIGESRQRVEKFINALDVDLNILLDENGEAVRDWRVYAFPSNFLIDKQGLIQYGYSGALEWDSKEVLDVIETLL